jgi:hypothetical protein
MNTAHFECAGRDCLPFDQIPNPCVRMPTNDPLTTLTAACRKLMPYLGLASNAATTPDTRVCINVCRVTLGTSASGPGKGVRARIIRPLLLVWATRCCRSAAVAFLTVPRSASPVVAESQTGLILLLLNATFQRAGTSPRIMTPTKLTGNHGAKGERSAGTCTQRLRLSFEFLKLVRIPVVAALFLPVAVLDGCREVRADSVRRSSSSRRTRRPRWFSDRQCGKAAKIVLCDRGFCVASSSCAVVKADLFGKLLT